MTASRENLQFLAAAMEEQKTNKGENEMSTLTEQIENAQERQHSFAMTALMYQRMAEVIHAEEDSTVFNRMNEEYDRAVLLAFRNSEAALEWMNKLYALHAERAASIESLGGITVA